MTQDVGTMRIKVVADTSDVEKSLGKTRKEMKEAEKESMRMRRSIARWETAQVGAKAGAKVIAGGLVAQRLMGSKGGPRVDSGGGGVKGFIAKTLIKGSLKKLIPGLAVAFGVGAVAKMLLGRKKSDGGSSVESELARQTQLLTGILLESTRSRRGLVETQAVQRTKEDPLRRSLAFQLARIQATGTAVTQYQTANAAALGSAQFEGRQIRDDYLRSRQSINAPYQAFGQRVKNRVGGFFGRATKAQAEAADDPTSTQILRLLRNPSAPNIESAMRALFSSKGNELTQSKVDEESRRITNLRIAKLSHVGPGNVLNAPATIQAGSEEEHAFRVGRERIAQQRELTKAWQDKMIMLTETLIEQGQADQNDLERQLIRFGRFEAL